MAMVFALPRPRVFHLGNDSLDRSTSGSPTRLVDNVAGAVLRSARPIYQFGLVSSPTVLIVVERWEGSHHAVSSVFSCSGSAMLTIRHRWTSGSSAHMGIG